MKQVLVTFGVMLVLTIGAFSAAKVKVKPHVYPAECVGCGDCHRICPAKGKAIHVVRGKAIIDLDKCIACKQCVYICSYGAVK